MQYTVEFLRDALVTEVVTATVIADSADEIEEKLKNGEYEATDFRDSDYSGDDDTIRDITIFDN